MPEVQGSLLGKGVSSPPTLSLLQEKCHKTKEQDGRDDHNFYHEEPAHTVGRLPMSVDCSSAGRYSSLWFRVYSLKARPVRLNSSLHESSKSLHSSGKERKGKERKGKAKRYIKATSPYLEFLVVFI